MSSNRFFMEPASVAPNNESDSSSHFGDNNNTNPLLVMPSNRQGTIVSPVSASKAPYLCPFSIIISFHGLE